MQNPQGPTKIDASHFKCPKCGSGKVARVPQEFADRSVHTRIECADCGRFIKFAPRTEGASYRQRLFRLVRRMADFDRNALVLGLGEAHLKELDHIIVEARSMVREVL